MKSKKKVKKCFWMSGVLYFRYNDNNNIPRTSIQYCCMFLLVVRSCGTRNSSLSFSINDQNECFCRRNIYNNNNNNNNNNEPRIHIYVYIYIYPDNDRNDARKRGKCKRKIRVKGEMQFYHKESGEILILFFKMIL